jgi:hypothetical protein
VRHDADAGRLRDHFRNHQGELDSMDTASASAIDAEDFIWA